MMEWLRFILTAVLLAAAFVSFLSAVVGVYRFDYVMNRMHAAGIGDTMGLFFVLLALGISAGSILDVMKLALVAFMWFTSPVSTHFMSQIEYFTNRDLYTYIRRERPGTASEPDADDPAETAGGDGK